MRQAGSCSDQDVREQPADEAVEDDGLGQREAEPLDALELAPELRLPGDRLDHRAEDDPDADAGTGRAEPDSESEPDRLAGLRYVAGRRGEDVADHFGFLLSAPARSPSRCRWRTGQRR